MSRTCSEPRRAGAGRAGAALALLVLGGCATLSYEQEAHLGAQVEQQMRRELPLVRDVVVARYLSDMGARILHAAGPQPFQYRFYVVADPEINAFAAPAGYVYVHTGTILKARSEDELAGVLAHEIGHVVHRHIAENYNRQRGVGLARQVLVTGVGIVAGGAMAGAANLSSSLAGMAYLNSFGREAENESDAFAVQVMPRAGYDPNALVSFFVTLQHESQGANVPTFLSSHPTTTERIEATRALIAAQGPQDFPRHDDRGRFEIIRRRIQLLTGTR
jgi:predicted Zn-dependent protease